MWRTISTVHSGRMPLPVDPPGESLTKVDPIGTETDDPAVVSQFPVGTMSTPDLVGMSSADARRIARLAGLRVESEERSATDGLWGRVLTQAPGPGVDIAPGAVVTLVVGRRPNVMLPDVRGLDEQEALSALIDLGLRPDRRAVRRSNDVPEGHVMRTRPRGGAEVPAGSRVAYVVAAGPRAKAGHGRREHRVREGHLPDGAFMTLPE